MTAPVELPVSSPSWFAQAECYRRGAEINDFYPDHARNAPEIIEAYCEHCPVINDCHDYAENGDEVGIWGALFRTRRGGVNGVTRTHTRAELEGHGWAGTTLPKPDTRRCPVCGRAERVRRDGAMRAHVIGPRGQKRRCDGSARYPDTAEAPS